MSRASSYIVAAAFALLVLVATHGHGLGVSDDSVSYAGAAQSMAREGTLEVPLTWWDSEADRAPLTHYPPVLSLVLAVPGALFDVDPGVAGRWLNAASIFATTLVLLLLMSERVSGLLVALALLLGPSFFQVHLWLWSEPLFLALLAVCFQLGLGVLESEEAGWRLPALGILCGIATLTRYAGLFLLPGYVLLLLLAGASWRTSIRRLLVYSAAYGITVLPWLAWLVAAGRAPRALAVHGAGFASEIRHGLLPTVGHWVLPEAFPFPLKLLLLGAAFVLVPVTVWRLYGKRGASTPAVAAFLLCCSYLAFVVAARLFSDSGLPFDDRVLSPALIYAALCLGGLAGSTVWKGRRAVAGAAILLAVAMSSAVATVPYFVYAKQHGNGYATEEWRRSETIELLRTLPEGVTVFSNRPHGLCAVLPVTAKFTPSLHERARLGEFKGRVERAGSSVVVLFDEGTSWLLGAEEVAAHLPAGEVRRPAGAVVLCRNRACWRPAG